MNDIGERFMNSVVSIGIFVAVICSVAVLPVAAYFLIHMFLEGCHL